VLWALSGPESAGPTPVRIRKTFCQCLWRSCKYKSTSEQFREHLCAKAEPRQG